MIADSRDIADPYDAIVLHRMRLVLEQLLDPLDQARAVVMASLEGNGHDTSQDSELLVQSRGVLSSTRTDLDLALSALVQLQKQLECDHDMHEQRLSISVGTSKCRKCDLVVEVRHK